ncbi:MAG: ATP-binding cassette domain-containing protein [Pseudomonadota bacterium]
MSFDVDIHLRRGETDVRAAFRTGDGITVLFGPSGIGKTSVLNMVAGLLRPDRGSIRVQDRLLFGADTDLPPERRRAGYVFQDARLFPHMRVEGNLRFGSPSPEDWSHIVGLLALAPLLDRWPRSLSGGEAKRVAIARALLAGSDFLLLDEPLASLDAARGDEILTLIERIRDERGLPMLYVTHDRREAERLASHIVEMERQ